MSVREYGAKGPCVVLVHGGPGAGGYLAPLARTLADSFRVLEPLQRGSGSVPLTVATHVADLEQLVQERCEGTAAVVGHSWGAMLALAHAAEYPHSARAIALIGCGTFDLESRDHMATTLTQRMGPELGRRVARLAWDVPDPDQRLRRFAELTLPAHSYDIAVAELPVDDCDARAHEETWNDALRLQREGHHPSAFAAIQAPVVMLHGADDPHPGRLIEASLRPHLPQLEYREWERCGHYPWLERAVRDDFVQVLRQWLMKRAPASGDRLP